MGRNEPEMPFASSTDNVYGEEIRGHQENTRFDVATGVPVVDDHNESDNGENEGDDVVANPPDATSLQRRRLAVVIAIVVILILSGAAGVCVSQFTDTGSGGYAGPM
jgi:hypothetical protein